MSTDVAIHLVAYDEASEIIEQMGSNLSATFTDIGGRTQDLVTTTDGATSKITDDWNQVNGAGQNLKKTQEDMQSSTSDTAMSMNRLAQSGANLFISFERVENAQVMVDRANLMVQRSTQTCEKAQTAYNDAVAKYGPNSAEAKAALDRLAIAQEAVVVSQERADMSARNFNNTIMSSALMVIPSFISIIGTVNSLLPETTAETFSLGAAIDFATGPIGLAIIAVSAMTAALVLIPGAMDAVVNAFETAGNFFVGIANDIGNAWGGFVGLFTGGNQQAEKSINPLTASVEDYTKAVKDSTTATDDYVGSINTLNSTVQNLSTTVQGAGQVWGPFSQAEETARRTTEDFTVNGQKYMADMEETWREAQASANVNLGQIKAEYEEEIDTGQFTKATDTLLKFAEQYGLLVPEAKKIVLDFKAVQASIPESIEEQLIGKAQADLQAFQDCVTGKFAGMQGDSSGYVKQLVTDTNDLISRGLVGQAQDNIAAYVKCATDKHDTLVSDIEADLAKLKVDYAAGATDLAPMIKQLEEFKLAATFGEPGVDIFAAIKLAGTTASEVAAETETATTQITASFQGMANNAILHAQRLQDSLVGQSIWTDMLTKMESTTEKSVAKIQGQFQMLQPEGLIGGGFGVPEALPRAGGGKVINAPIRITIEGNADRATVDLMKKEIFAALKSVVVEPTSSNAPTTSKRIRQGSTF
ncbi:MAG: hypothetical protein ABSB28_08625 [Candidatus Bathyarchaeia archaeon]